MGGDGPTLNIDAKPPRKVKEYVRLAARVRRAIDAAVGDQVGEVERVLLTARVLGQMFATWGEQVPKQVRARHVVAVTAIAGQLAASSPAARRQLLASIGSLNPN